MIQAGPPPEPHWTDTGLAIQTDVLPEEPPAALQKENALLTAEHFNTTGQVAVIDIGGVITPYPNILSMLFGGTDISSLEAQFGEALPVQKFIA